MTWWGWIITFSAEWLVCGNPCLWWIFVFGLIGLRWNVYSIFHTYIAITNIPIDISLGIILFRTECHALPADVYITLMYTINILCHTNWIPLPNKYVVMPVLIYLLQITFYHKKPYLIILHLEQSELERHMKHIFPLIDCSFIYSKGKCICHTIAA